MNGAVGEAPGKILLIGEHSVVYGHPAIAIPLRSVTARAEVEFTHNGAIEVVAPKLGERASSTDSSTSRLGPLVRLAAEVMELFGEPAQGVRIGLSSTIPVGCGMGSSAAAAVAVVRGICRALDRRLDAEQEAELALEAEKGFHGNPSGVDPAVVARNEPIYFVRGKPIQTIAVGPSVFRFLIADTGISSPTIKVVQEIRDAWERDRARYDSMFWELGSMTTVAREVIRTGAPEELAMCMNRAHRVLQSLGVSCTELDTLVETAIENGALGAKLSGAGRGGVIIALMGESTDEDQLAAKLAAAGAETVLIALLGGERGK